MKYSFGYQKHRAGHPPPPSPPLSAKSLLDILGRTIRTTRTATPDTTNASFLPFTRDKRLSPHNYHTRALASLVYICEPPHLNTRPTKIQTPPPTMRSATDTGVSHTPFFGFFFFFWSHLTIRAMQSPIPLNSPFSPTASRVFAISNG